MSVVFTMPVGRGSFGPAVKDGQLLYTSPSALAKFDPTVEGGCPTRWWLRYVRGEEEPQTVDQKDGVEGHSQLEFFGRTGDDVLGPIARAGKHLVHPPEPDALVEVSLERLTADGLKVVGFVDRVNLSGGYVDPEGRIVVEKGVPEVIDYKFVKDFTYAKLGDKLLTTQMVAYAEEMRRRHLDAEQIRISHIYFSKRRRAAVKSTKVFSTLHVTENWRIRGDAVVQQMRGVAVAQRLEEVPKQTASCSAFGGCPFKKHCFHSPIAQLRASIKGADMGLLDKIKSIQGNGAKAPVQMISPPEGKKTESENTLEVSKCEIGAKYLVEGALGEYTGSSKEWGFFLAGEKPVRLPLTAKVSLVTTFSSGQTGVPASGASDTPSKREAKVEEVKVIEPKVEARTDPKVETKTKVERKMRIKDVSEQKPTSEAIPEKGIRLYLNSIPSGSYETLDDFVNRAARELAAQYNLDDVRFATDSDHPLAFGRWKGALASLVRSKLPTDGSYVAYTMGSEMVQVVAEALVPYAAFIVRGVR